MKMIKTAQVTFVCYQNALLVLALLFTTIKTIMLIRMKTHGYNGAT